MTIFEALGIEEHLIDITIPKETILDNLQSGFLARDAKRYFEKIDSVILRASLQRDNFELQVLEISLNEPKYIQEISTLIQTAIKYRILFVFSYDDRYLLVRRNFRLTASTDHVYSEHFTYTTEWIYKENLIPDILSCYQFEETTNETDDYFAFSSAYWKSDDSKTQFYEAFSDILINIGKLNQCMIESNVLSLRQFCDWYVGHSTKERLELMTLIQAIIQNNGMQYHDGTMFFEKSIVSYSIANLENSKYLRSVDHFGRHPFTYFDGLDVLNEYEIEDFIHQCLYSENHIEITAKSANNFEGFVDDTISKYFSLVGHHPILSAQKERYLLEQAQDGDDEARELLIKSNLKLVVSIAKNYAHNGVALDDLIQEGTLGLITAIEKHDTWYDNRFATYAKYWIKQAIQRAICDQASLIRIPVHFSEDIDKVKKAKRELEFALCREASISDIAKHVKMSEDKVREILKFSDGFVVYEDPINELGESAISLAIDENETPDEWLFQKDLRSKIERELHTLTPREEKVLRLRFGLDDGRTKTLEEVGRAFDITRERIREIEAKALRKLRHPSRARHLRGFLDADSTPNNGYIGFAQEDYSTPASPFIDDIIRRHKLRGYHILEEQNLSAPTILRARRYGYQVLEQFKKLSFEELTPFTTSMVIDLILCMDSHRLRLADCSITDYPSVEDYLCEKIKCKSCGEDITNSDWSRNKGYCIQCQARKARLASPREVEVSISNIEYSMGFLYADVGATLSLQLPTHLQGNIQLSKAEFVTSSNQVFAFGLSSNIENDSLTENLHSTSNEKLSFDLNAFERVSGTLDYIKVVVLDKCSGYRYFYSFKIEEHEGWGGIFYLANLYDYDEELIMTERQKCEMQKLIREQIAFLNGIELPYFSCDWDGECLGFCVNCQEATKWLEVELNKRVVNGEFLRLEGIDRIPYDKAIQVRPPLPKAVDFTRPPVTTNPPKPKETIDYSNMWIEELDFSVRTFNILKRAGIDSVADLISRTEEDMIRVRNMGRYSLREIVEKLANLGLSLLDSESSATEAEDNTKNKLYALTLEELDLSVRAYNCLKRAGIDTVGDLASKTYNEILMVRNLGLKCTEEVVAKLTSLGLALKE